MNKIQVFACEYCGQEFEESSSLLRHISHKESCKNFYGEDRILKMRWNGKRMANKKWNQKLRYKRKQENKSSVASLKRSDENNNGPYYPYIPEIVRQRTIEGVVFHKLFKAIYERKKLEALEEFQEFALSSVFNRCVDVILDELFGEEYFLDVAKRYINFYEKGAKGGYLEHTRWVYLPHFTYEDFFIENFELEMEMDFNHRVKKKKLEEEKKLIEYATLHLSRKCFKLCENTAFNHFFAKFRDMFPVIERGEEDKLWYKCDFNLLKEKRHEKQDVKDFVSEYLRSEPAKKLEEILESKILKHVAYLKENVQ